MFSALRSSTAYLLIASPSARQSPWVNKELEFWLTIRGTENLFIVLGEGEIVWDRESGCFDPATTTALPASLMTCFSEEPLWEDLRGVHTRSDSDRIVSVAAGVVAAISQVPKDDVFGEDLRQQKTIKRIAVSVAAALSLLIVGLVAVSAEAIHQRNVARSNGSVALAHAMSASARTLLDTRLSTAIALSLGAHSLHDDVSTRSALLQALSYDPHFVRFFHVKRSVSDMAWDGDSGRLLLWARLFVSVADPATGALVTLSPPRGVSAVAASRGPGNAVAIGSRSGQIELASVVSGADLWRRAPFETAVRSMTFDSSRGRLAAVTITGDVALLSSSHGVVLSRRQLDLSTVRGKIVDIAFEDSGTRLVVTTELGETFVLSTDTLADISAPTPPVLQGSADGLTSFASSNAGASLSTLAHRSISTLPMAGQPTIYDFPGRLPRHPGSFSISGDGSRAAVEMNGAVSIIQAKPFGVRRTAPLRLPGAGTMGSVLRVSPDNSLLATSYGSAVGVWDLRRETGIARSFPVVVPRAKGVGPAEQILPDPQGRGVIMLADRPAGAPSKVGMVCVRDGGAQTSDVFVPGINRNSAMAWDSKRRAVLVSTAHPTAIRRIGVKDGCPANPVSSLADFKGEAASQIESLSSLEDSSVLVLLKRGRLYRVSPTGAVLQSWGDHGGDAGPVSSYAVSPDGRELVLGSGNGAVEKYTLDEGRLTPDWKGEAGIRRVHSIAFVTSTLVAVSTGQGNVYLINRQSGALTRRLGGAQGFILSPADSGEMLVGSEPGYRIAVWDTASGQLMARFAFSYPAVASSGGSTGQRSEQLTSVTPGVGGYLWFGVPGAYSARWDFDVRDWEDVACESLYHPSAASLATFTGGPEWGSGRCPQ